VWTTQRLGTSCLRFIALASRFSDCYAFSGSTFLASGALDPTGSPCASANYRVIRQAPLPAGHSNGSHQQLIRNKMQLLSNPLVLTGIALISLYLGGYVPLVVGIVLIVLALVQSSLQP
jgi:hypothetical protein